MSTSIGEKRIAYWLLAICAMVFVMILLGGVTRLTESGLSIAEWKPVVGAALPWSDSQWQSEFETYQQTPEYRKINAGMDLAAFKRIYLMEWSHRQWGRLIFFAALLPLMYFAWRREIPVGHGWRLAAVPIGVALNGALGWFMVASGLVDIPRVSAYRLTAHLAFALAIYSYTLWTALGLLSPYKRAGIPASVRGHGLGVVVLVVVTILAGGFVAGTRAGWVFNDWPWMNGRFVPEGLYDTLPLWRDWFENVATVQFHHRLLAYALLAAVPAWWLMSRRMTLDSVSRLWFRMLVAVLGFQVLLGITTLMHRVPVALGAAHQGGAVLVLTVTLIILHRIRR